MHPIESAQLKTGLIAIALLAVIGSRAPICAQSQVQHQLKQCIEFAQEHSVSLTAQDLKKNISDELAQPLITGLLARIESQVPWFRRIWFAFMNECNRDPQAWQYDYIDELTNSSTSFELKVHDSSLGERHANTLYLANLHALGDLSFFKFNSGDPTSDREHLNAVAGAQVNDDQSERELLEMAVQLARANTLDPERRIRLARALDSFGRYESGALAGNSKLLGDYNECLQSNLLSTPSSSQLIDMRHCWAQVSLDSQLNERLRRRPRLEHETANGAELSSGVCVPRACHSRSFANESLVALVQQLVESQLVFPKSIYSTHNSSLTPATTYRVELVFCQPDEDSQCLRMPTSGKLCLAFIALWTCACTHT